MFVPPGEIKYYVFDRNGEFIHVSYANGDMYIGEWKNCKGFGVMKYHDGRVYDGEWCDGEYNGKGTYECGEYVYNGSYRKGKKHGYGIFTRGGYTYRGYWKDNIFHNKGVVVCPEGRVIMTTQFNTGDIISYKILK